MSDNVNHPQHYTQGGIECIDALKAATVGKTGIEAVCVANVIKYLWRYEEKNGLEDIRKAQWYLERLIKEHTNDLEYKQQECLNNNDFTPNCNNCYYCYKEAEEEPCCNCKNTVIYGSLEYKKRPDMYKKA